MYFYLIGSKKRKKSSSQNNIKSEYTPLETVESNEDQINNILSMITSETRNYTNSKQLTPMDYSNGSNQNQNHLFPNSANYQQVAAASDSLSNYMLQQQIGNILPPLSNDFQPPPPPHHHHSLGQQFQQQMLHSNTNHMPLQSQLHSNNQFKSINPNQVLSNQFFNNFHDHHLHQKWWEVRELYIYIFIKIYEKNDTDKNHHNIIS